VYEHLDEGAQALCPETFQALRSSLEVPALEHGAEPAPDAAADAPAKESAPA
jgi:hypothetical protein